MRILFLTAYSYPEQTPSSYLGRQRNEAFISAGHDLIVYAPVPTRGVPDEVRNRYKRELRHETGEDGHTFVHHFNLMRENGGPAKRALRYFLQTVKHFNRAVFAPQARTCDLMFIFSTPPIQGAMAALVKKIRHIPFIYNLQDIFPDSLVGAGIARKNGLLWKTGRVIENFTYRNADKIIVISEDFKKNIMAKGVPEEKIEVIYNWVDEDAVADIPRQDNKLFEKYGLDPSKFYITYAGNIGLTQNIDMLLSVMEELSAEAPDVQLVLVGEGACKDKVVQEIGGVMGDDGAVRGSVLPNVTMLPFQPYEDISHVFSLGDAGLVISKPGVGNNSVPSKTWKIMAASRPVLANFDENEMKDIIAGNHCGIFTKAGDKEAFKASVLELYHNPELCREYGLKGRQFVMENLTKDVGVKKYVDVIKSFEKN